MVQLRFGSHTFEASNLDKPMFPQAGISKGDLLDYYRDLAEVMLPYLRDRPLVMHRFPGGIERPGFYQQHRTEQFPEWIDTATVAKRGGTVDHVVCNNAATLVYLANQACITPHPWLSRADAPRQPDRLVFDLDPAAAKPGAEAFQWVRKAAWCLREALEVLNLNAYLMTSGSRGLHVVVPIEPVSDVDMVHEFARDLAFSVAGQYPRQLTAEQRKERRGQRLFIDYLRNTYAQTSVAPYAVRALPGAPVAAPLDWEELDDPGLHPQRYNICNIGRRLGQKPDPWIGLDQHRHDLGRARELSRRMA